MKAVCFGEVLFDSFPTYSKIGGAPLNVSLRLQSFGVDVSIVSSIGDDERGKKIMNHLNNSGIDTSCIYKHGDFPTGVVNVGLNDKGVASYDIPYPVAWDKIPFLDKYAKLVRDSNFFVFGTLVSRDDVSRSTLKGLLKQARYKVLDANLRFPHYNPRLLVDLMMEANFIKFNDDELFEIATLLGSKYNSLEQTIVYVATKTNTKTICVTKGAYGATLYQNKCFYYNSGYRIKVVDTVGSGDSFLASLLFKLFSEQGPQKALDYGCAVGAMVASCEGANPFLSKEKITLFMNPQKCNFSIEKQAL